MTFVEALVHLKAGRTVTNRETLSLFFNDGGDLSSIDGDGNENTIIVTTDIIDDTSYEVMEETIDDELFAFYSEEKNRWVSTTNPDKHRAAGQNVARFVLAE